MHFPLLIVLPQGRLLYEGGVAFDPGLLGDAYLQWRLGWSLLQAALTCAVSTTESVGVGTQDVEALAFAWLAWAHQHGVAAGNPKVTGARGARILGATWPA